MLKSCVCCSFVPADAVDKGDSMVIGTPKLFAISSATKGSKALVLSAKLEQVREFRTFVFCCRDICCQPQQCLHING